MTDLLATVATGITLLALLGGCAAHLSRPAALPAALRAHALLPAGAVPAAAAAVPAAEGLLAAGGGVALLTGDRRVLAGALGAGALLFGAYALYTRHALAAGRAGPCGCARTELPLSGWITARAAAFAACSAAGAALTGPTAATFPTGGARQAIALLAAFTLTLLLWTLPAAMHDPSAPAGADGQGRAHLTTAGATGGPQWTS